MKVRFLVSFPLLLFPALAQQVELPQSPAGKHVDAYLKAFNSGDEVHMREFFAAHLAKESLRRVGIDQRIVRWREMDGRLQSLGIRPAVGVLAIKNYMRSSSSTRGT